MKKSLLAVLFLALLVPAVFAMTQPPQKSQLIGVEGKFFLIDNFEDGNFTENPEWWKFDRITMTVVDNAKYQDGDSAVASAVGKYSLNVQGQAKNWYVGGCGTYLAKDASMYNSFQLDIYGTGPDSGTVKVELYDDDNGNLVIEQDKNYVPMYDDKWVYEQKIDWKGWQRVTIPFSSFNLDNPGKGNGKHDLDQKNGSGGLIQLQLIAVASTEDGKVNYNLDNLMLVEK